MEREEREQEVRAEELAWAAKTKVISASIVAGVPVVSADVLGGKAGSSGEAWRCVRLHSSEEKILHAEVCSPQNAVDHLGLCRWQRLSCLCCA